MTRPGQRLGEVRRYIPGGMNGPVRAPGAADEAGNTYIGGAGLRGPAIPGHAHHTIVKAVRGAALAEKGGEGLSTRH
jgi:hypothetical protein